MGILGVENERRASPKAALACQLVPPHISVLVKSLSAPKGHKPWINRTLEHKIVAHHLLVSIGLIAVHCIWAYIKLTFPPE